MTARVGNIALLYIKFNRYFEKDTFQLLQRLLPSEDCQSNQAITSFSAINAANNAEYCSSLLSCEAGATNNLLPLSSELHTQAFDGFKLKYNESSDSTQSLVTVPTQPAAAMAKLGIRNILTNNVDRKVYFIPTPNLFLSLYV